MADAGKRRVRPLALKYAERVPLENRPGRYDEDHGVWMIGAGEGQTPLVRTGRMLDETATKVRADPSDPAWPRRGTGGSLALDETETRVRADTADPGSPRRSGVKSDDINRRMPTARTALDETKTAVRADRDDPPSPRRVTMRR